MSRPSFRATKDQRKLVHALAAYGLRQEHIAVVVGIRSPKTLRKHFRKDIQKGNAEATATVTAAAYAMAVSGDFPGVTRFWLNTVGGGLAMPFEDAGQEVPGTDAVVELADGDD